MTTIYLIRHAEAEGNLYRRAQGHHNSTITDRGYRQIAALSRRFADIPIDAVYASDLCRTCTTAKSVTLSHGLPLHTTQELREIGMGVWEDKPWAELGHSDEARLVLFNTDLATWSVEGGQSAQSVRERMLRALHSIIAAHPGETVAVFSHGMALRILIGTLQGLSLAEIDKTGHAENTGVTKLEAEDGNIRVVYRDDASHLSDEIATLRAQKWWRDRKGIEPNGIFYVPLAGEDGAFAVRRGEESIGELRVAIDGSAGVLTRYELAPDCRGKNYGVQLLGQALSYARGFGCDTLRITLPASDAALLRRFAGYGFTAARETAENVVFEKYFGYSEEYQVKKIQEAIKL